MQLRDFSSKGPRRTSILILFHLLLFFVEDGQSAFATSCGGAITTATTTSTAKATHTCSTTATSIPTYNNRTVFQSPSNYTVPGTLYARTVTLNNGDILATWENYSPEPPAVYFPIYKSTDMGQSWKAISRVVDTARGFGLRYQPFLYVLPESFGGFDKGDLLLSGNSIPTNLSSTHIELYASRDGGVTWEFVSHIADGGVAEPVNGDTPVWEPFLLLYRGQLVCFYSDQRDPKHGQKLVHQISSDGKTWNEVVDDVAYDDYTARPGMTTVARLNDGNWIMTYEYGHNDSSTGEYGFPVYYKVSSSPLTFDGVEGQALVAEDGTVPQSSPYVVVSKGGMVIVSCGTLSEAFVNHPGRQGINGSAWKKVMTGERVSYSRSLNLMNANHVLIAGGGNLPPSKGNKVTVGLVDISGW